MVQATMTGVGPRVAGGRYLNGYWDEEYTVVAVHTDPDDVTAVLGVPAPWAITVRYDGDHQNRTHCTAWDPARDRAL